MGDSGTGNRMQAMVAEEIRRKDPDLILFLGDLVYPRGEWKDYANMFFKPYAKLIPRIPHFPTVGNHAYGNVSDPEKGAAYFAEGYSRAHRRPKYYSFNAGDVHFVSIDNNRVYGILAAEPLAPGTPQWEWLEREVHPFPRLRAGDRGGCRAFA